MTNKKSGLRLLTSIVLVAGTVALAGCGSDKSTSTTTTEQSSSMMPVAPPTSTTTTTTSSQSHP